MLVEPGVLDANILAYAVNADALLSQGDTPLCNCGKPVLLYQR